jgi:hypothetical protein
MRNATGQGGAAPSQEGATPKRDVRTPCTWNAIAASPTLPHPRFAELLARRFGAPFHSKELQRSAVPKKLLNPPRSELTKKVKLTEYEKSFSIIALVGK